MNSDLVWWYWVLGVTTFLIPGIIILLDDSSIIRPLNKPPPE